MTQKERIIEQAMRMFVTQGIKSVRMDDIAQQLGVSNGRSTSCSATRKGCSTWP